MELSKYSEHDIEFMVTPNNPAIRQARELINKVIIPRAEMEDRIAELKERVTKDQVQCVNCRRKKIYTLYDKSEMLLIERKVIKKGKKVLSKQYYCKICGENYKPQSQRAGGKNY